MLRFGLFFGVCAVATLAVVGCNEKNEPPAMSISQVGESCERTADCAVSLACFGGTCRLADSKVTPNGKECKAIQCDSAADCCTSVWQKDSMCATYEQQCALSPTSTYCDEAKGPECACSESNYSCTNNLCKRIECTAAVDCCATRWTRSSSCTTAETYCAQDPTLYASYCATATGPSCVCNETTSNYGCVNNVCVTQTSCTTDTNCTLSTARRCSAGHCVACIEDTDCTATGAKCINNACVAPQCVTDSDCPIFSVCETDTATCKSVGCATDRECMTRLDSYMATCNKSATPVPTCELSCERDAQCMTADNPLRVCSKGHCMDAGCDTDEECKIQMKSSSGTTSLTKGTQYLCRDAAAD